MSKRLSVPKTYKLAIGGAFPRSESGRTYEVLSTKGDFLANAAKASRKDARDAVVAARAAVKGWSGATAYNRGQVLYRVAEILEGRYGALQARLERLAARLAEYQKGALREIPELVVPLEKIADAPAGDCTFSYARACTPSAVK